MTKRTWLGGISVGDGQDVAVAGALNVSPESFYDGSVVIQADHLLRAAEAMTRAGAAFVDVGAMSTAPYLAARIPESQEADRLAWAIDLLVKKLDLPISADTSRSLPARAALAAGARIINDVTGLTGDPQMARLAGRAGVGLILMASEASNREDRAAGRRGAGAPASERGGQGSASRRTARGWGPGVRGEQSGRSSRRTARGWGPGVRGEQSGRSSRRTARGWGPGVRGEQSGRSSRGTARGWGPGVRGEQIPGSGDPIEIVRALLEESIGIARAAGIDPSLIVVDPGIGFFRNQDMAWHEWDCQVLARLHEVRELGWPVCVGVSRKSFIGAVAGEEDPTRRLPGSLSATAVAVLGGAHIIRTHDVEETVQAVRVAEAIRRARQRT